MISENIPANYEEIWVVARNLPTQKMGGGNVTIWDQRKNLRDSISMHIIFVQFLIERVSDLTIAYLFYIISTFTKDIRKQSPIT
jgi:hypothetical protein